jgi:hypothetical protein
MTDIEKTLNELKESLKADLSWVWFIGGCWIGIAICGVCVYFFG